MAVLVIDSASPVNSIALGTSARVLAERTIELRRSSELLLTSIDEVLDEGGIRLRELDAVVALRGPGSFTGLRIGLATVLGFHQALGLPATAVPTLSVLALVGVGGATAGPAAQPRRAGAATTVIPAVDALRGEWYVRAGGEEGLRSAAQLASFAPCRVVGFGIGALAGEVGDGVELAEPPPLAAAALELTEGLAWDPDLLRHPIYFRPPGVTLPKRAKQVSRSGREP